MKKKMLSLLLAAVLCLTPAAALEEPSQSGQVVAKALSMMGYAEGDRGYTLFGQRYGYPRGHWCDMFVSWCAEEAGVPAEIFPASISCGEHYRMFREKEQFQPSAARGGQYIPQQGDLVFFYNTRGVIHHIGLVLYTENGQVFTVEGNALTNRRDVPAAEVSAQRQGALDPPDYVTVNRYLLEDSRLYGYAVPAYASREPLALEGYADLGDSGALAFQLEALSANGVLSGTSSHTFSPRDGMPIEEFAGAILTLSGIRETGDAPEALTAAQSAGLLPEGLNPERYISGEEAQGALSQVLARMGLEDQTFSFTEGDLAYACGTYATRASLAQALYALQESALTLELFQGTLTLWGKDLDWPALSLDGECYVPLSLLLEQFPELSADGMLPESKDTGAAEDLEETEDSEETEEPEETENLEGTGNLEAAEVPEAGPLRGTGTVLRLEMEGRGQEVRGAVCGGVLYAPVEPVAALLGVKLLAVPA
ncbi:MAG: CHAP domain-containing protein [Oscillibacter sp.]|nr:CHAP domain-containing protein [Oscillibacter sp.]